MFNKHFLWLFQNVSILTEPGTNHDASLFLRATSLSCRTIFTGRNRRFPCCIRPGQNTPGQTKAPFSPRNAEKRVQVNVFTWPCRNRHSPVRSPQALSSEKLRSAVRSEVLDGTDHLRGVGVLVVVPRHDLNLVGVVVATPVFRTLFVVVPNFETTVTVPQRTVVVLNPACSYHYYTINPIMLQDFAVGLWFRRLQKRVRKIRFFPYCIQDSPISSFHLQKSRLYTLIFWFYPLLCKGHLSIFDLCWGDFTTPPSYYIGRLFQIFNHPPGSVEGKTPFLHPI